MSENAQKVDIIAGIATSKDRGLYVAIDPRGLEQFILIWKDPKQEHDEIIMVSSSNLLDFVDKIKKRLSS